MTEEGGNGAASDTRQQVPRKRRPHQKAKTGCLTCRIRRVKCDEGRPACNGCLSTGRTCDGYESVFRISNPGPPSSVQHLGFSLTHYRPETTIITADEVSRLAHLFTIKRTSGEVRYYTEARATIACRGDPAIQHAVNSLSALCDSFELNGSVSSLAEMSGIASVRRGLEEYNAAVAALATRLKTEPSPTAVRSVLLCCRLFICIEVTLGNYASAMQHCIRGLRIMYQYRTRPTVDASGNVVPSSGADLPCLDVFVIKLFASGWSHDSKVVRSKAYQAGLAEADVSYLMLQSNARDKLGMLSVEVSEFFAKLSKLRHPHQVDELLQWKAQLLGALQSWEDAYSRPIQQIMDGSFPIAFPLARRFGIGFSALLHQTLRLTVQAAMNSCAIGEGEGEGGAWSKILRDVESTAEFLTEIKNKCAKQPWNRQ